MRVLEGCCVPAQSSFRLLYVSMAGVVHLLHVDLGHEHQVAGVVLLALVVEVVLLGFSPSSQVLHLTPQRT